MSLRRVRSQVVIHVRMKLFAGAAIFNRCWFGWVLVKVMLNFWGDLLSFRECLVTWWVLCQSRIFSIISGNMKNILRVFVIFVVGLNICNN